MNSITPDDLQRDLAAFLDRVEAGECLIVSRAGRPVAELRPLPPSPQSARPFGLAAGDFVVPDDFDAALPEEILRDFEGR